MQKHIFSPDARKWRETEAESSFHRFQRSTGAMFRSESSNVLTYCEVQYMLIYGNTPLMRPIHLATIFIMTVRSHNPQ